MDYNIIHQPFVYRVYRFTIKVDYYNSTVFILNTDNSLKDLFLFIRSLDKRKINSYTVDLGSNHLLIVKLLVKDKYISHFINKDIIPRRINFI